MKINYLNLTKALILTCLAFAFTSPASAQLNPMGALYFQNQYLGNPALAGTTTGLELNLGYRKQWSNMPGSPSMQTLTADYKLNDRIGLGLNIYNDKAGLFKKTRTLLSYAYRLPLNQEDRKLSFGLSLGFMKERINNEELSGDAGDLEISSYNDREIAIDGDFGLAYTDTKLSIQAALPALNNLLQRDTLSGLADRSTFFSAVSYRIQLTEGTDAFSLEPKVCYRGVQGFDNILDAGANLTYAGRLNFFGMYHSSKSTTFGLGMNYQSMAINGIYSSSTSQLRSSSGGIFEISLTMNLLKKDR